MPADWVKPLKVEPDQDMGWPTEMNPTEDGLFGAGIAFEGSDMYIVRDGSDLTLFDPVIGSKYAKDFTFNNKIITSTTTAGDESVILADCSSSAFTLNLPDATTSEEKVYYIKRTDHTASNVLTIDPNGSQTIDGDTTFDLRRGEAITLISDGSNWQVL